VIPAEVYPVRLRTTGHGISAASGKLSAAITTYLFPLLLHQLGIKDILIMLAVVSIIGALLTALFVPESKDKNLEEASREEIATPTASEWELKRREKKKLSIFHRYPLNLSFYSF
jgi:PHS family inorganic phosphate transporter-like MFS transporter